MRIVILSWFIYDDCELQKMYRNNLQDFQDRLKEDFHWKTVIDEFNDGVVLLSKDNKIKYKNRSMKKFFDQKKDVEPQVEQGEGNNKKPIEIRQLKYNENVLDDEGNVEIESKESSNFKKGERFKTF